MNWLNRLPGHRASAPGWEWSLWKRLPAILAWGSALPLGGALLLWLGAPATGQPGTMLLVYQLLGLVVLHWTLVLTLGIGCVIVRVMKGPAYVADPYPPPGREPATDTTPPPP